MDYQYEWNEIWFELNQCFQKKSNEADYHEKLEDCINGHLGWSKRGEIIHKKRFPSGHTYVEADIVIEKKGEVQWIVEVKEPMHKQGAGDLNQLFSYMRLAKVPLGVYVGEHIELFYDKDGAEDPTSIFKFNIEMDSKAGFRFVELLCKENFSKEKAIAFCEEKVLEKQRGEQLAKIIERMKGEDGSDFIIKLLKDSLLKDNELQFTKEELDKASTNLSFKALSRSSKDAPPAISSTKNTVTKDVKDITSNNTDNLISSDEEKPYVFSFKQKKLGIVSTLHYYRNSKRFIIKAGSKIKASHKNSCPSSLQELRDIVFSDASLCSVENGIATLLNDFGHPKLDSPSSCAVFCCGRSANGPQSWMDDKGKPHDTAWWRNPSAI